MSCIASVTLQVHWTPPQQKSWDLCKTQIKNRLQSFANLSVSPGGKRQPILACKPRMPFSVPVMIPSSSSATK